MSLLPAPALAGGKGVQEGGGERRAGREQVVLRRRRRGERAHALGADQTRGARPWGLFSFFPDTRAHGLRTSVLPAWLGFQAGQGAGVQARKAERGATLDRQLLPSSPLSPLFHTATRRPTLTLRADWVRARSMGAMVYEVRCVCVAALRAPEKRVCGKIKKKRESASVFSLRRLRPALVL